ncbi:MAG: AAA family ATPase [Desulfobacterales bacterium]|nr:AAA family ATPase [Desulfobacterales bacterium]
MAQYDVDLRDYWRIIKKRKSIILLMVLMVGVCSYGFAKLKEPRPLFSATAAIKIERSTTMASLFMGGFFTQGENLVTHAYIVTSYPVLMETAKALGLLPADLTLDAIRSNKKYLEDLEALKKKVTAAREEGTNIINIEAISTAPEEAALIANTIARAYREFNIREKNRKTFETKAFIEEQLGKTHQNLKAAEDKLRSFKEGYALFAMDVQTQNLLSRLDGVETEYEQVHRQQDEIDAQFQMFEQTTAGTTISIDRLHFSPDPDSPLYALRAKLGEMLLKRETLKMNYTDEHPEVMGINDNIRAVVTELSNELKTLLEKLNTREQELNERLNTLRQQSMGLPEKALKLVRLQREVATYEALYSQLKARHQETLISESGRIEEVSIVRPALVPLEPFNIPSKTMIVLTGLVMGLIIGVLLGFGLEVFDTSMGTIEDVEALLKVPVIGVIPFMNKDEKNKKGIKKIISDKDRKVDLIAHYDPKSLLAEAFRTLRSNLEFMRVDKKSKSFLVTSSFVQEGKTFNVVNLALSMAQLGKKVLLVEADLRKPVIHKMFGINRIPGLTDYILGNYTWQEIRHTITDVMLGDFELEEILRTPGLDNLNIITAGTNPPNPAEILRSERFKDFLSAAYKQYDMIFIDAPPVLPVADATEISTLVDGILMVYTVGKIGRGVLKRAKVNLDNVGGKVVGIILNNVKPEAGPDYFKYHTQYYYGPDSDDKKTG